MTQNVADLPDGDGDDYRLTRVGLTTIGTVQIFSAHAEVLRDCGYGAELESFLTRAAEEYLAPLGLTPRWVSRTMLTHPAPELWMSGEPQCINDSGHPLALGWANNAISPELVDTDTWEEIISGLIDAQFLWVQVDDIAQESRRSIREIIQSPSSKAHLSKSTQLRRDWISHELALDEVRSSIQGSRKLVAEAQLSAWDFIDMRNRSLQRLKDLEALTSQELEKRRSGYQSAVELILFMLGLTALLQTVLALIQTAFAVADVDAPASRGFLAWIRATNLDILIGMSAIASFSALCTVMVLRSRSRND